MPRLRRLFARDEGCPRLGTTTVVTLAASALTAVGLWSVLGSSPSGAATALAVAVGVAACALVPFILRRPTAGALAGAVLAAVNPAATPVATFGTLHVARRRPLGEALGVAGVGVGAHLLRWLWWPTPGISLGWWILLVAAVHAALVLWGALAQSREALIRSLRERAERAEADQRRQVDEARQAERTRIAREMHDVLAHRLSLLATYAGALEYRTDASPEQVAHAAGVVRAGTHQALEDLRDVIGVLRFEVPDGERARPQPTLADLEVLTDETRSAGTDVTLTADVEVDALPEAVGRTAYRVVQEALTNVRKHAPGAAASVHLTGTPGARLEVTVANGAAHARVGAAVVGSSTGLVGLAERVHLAGGELDHGPLGEGYVVRASLPWPA